MSKMIVPRLAPEFVGSSVSATTVGASGLSGWVVPVEASVGAGL